MNLDIEKIATTNQQIWISINEVIHDYYFKLVKLFPSKLKKNVKIIQMNLRTYHLKSEHLKNDGFGKWVVCTSVYDLQKGVR